jgi:hypothetical protein
LPAIPIYGRSDTAVARRDRIEISMFAARLRLPMACIAADADQPEIADGATEVNRVYPAFISQP